MAEQKGAWSNPRRGSTVGAVRPSAVFENFYEKASNDPDAWDGYNTQSAGGGFLVVDDSHECREVDEFCVELDADFF